ncbi:MAG: hypothetical protein ACKER6_01330 [Candidatus Hodgkinia cicadicola]
MLASAASHQMAASCCNLASDAEATLAAKDSAVSASAVREAESRPRPNWPLTPSTRHLARTFAETVGLNIYKHCVYVDGVVDLMSAIIRRGGAIFADERSLGLRFESEALKHRVVCIADILRVRSRAPSQHFDDVLAKIAAVVEPSSCVLALGTWPTVASMAIEALELGSIPAAMAIVCPLFTISENVWESWFVASKAIPFLSIQTGFGGTDFIGIALDAIDRWGSGPHLALPKPEVRNPITKHDSTR